MLAGAALLVSACWRPGTAPRGFSRSPDVVLVTVDTLRADAPGFSGGTRAKTPNIDRIASEGTVFPDAHAQNVVTLPSHVNILTGLYPYQHGVRDNDGFRLAAETPTLATYLKRAGFKTGAFIGAFPLDSRFGLSRDFDVYDQHYPQGAHAYDFVMPERPATEVVSAALAWFRSAGEGPRFLWVHLYDCHAPYRPPPPFSDAYRGAPYFGEVAAVDAALAPLFDEVRGDERETLFVLTGDHGEALGDHGELTHGLFAYEATLHVPLIVWSPQRKGGVRDERLARHVDILPTVLAAERIAIPVSAPGRDLLAPADPAATSYFEALSSYLNRGWAPLRGEIGPGRRKYVDLPLPELYDLGADPGETKNLFDVHGKDVRALRATLPADLGAFGRTASTREEEEKLRSLGYLSGRAAPKAAYGPGDDPKNLVALDRKLHEVVDLYQRGDLPKALAAARRIVAERPTMQTGYEFLSFVQSQEGDDAGAIRSLQDADRRALLSPEMKGRLGLLLAGVGRAREALRVLEPLAGSADPEVLNALGIARVGAGDLAGGIAAFEKASRADVRDATAWQNMGIAWLQAGRTNEALKSFEKAFAVNDRLPRAWNAYGVALERSGRAREAVAAWRRSVALDPEQFDAIYNIALVSRTLGDTAACREALEDFVRRAPSTRYGSDLARARKMLAELGGSR